MRILSNSFPWRISFRLQLQVFALLILVSLFAVSVIAGTERMGKLSNPSLGPVYKVR